MGCEAQDGRAPAEALGVGSEGLLGTSLLRNESGYSMAEMEWVE